jgi:hypothetical protein
MQLNESSYSFFFGTVYARALLKCKTTDHHGDEKRLCGSEKVRSSEIDLGIKSKTTQPVEPLEPGELLNDSFLYVYKLMNKIPLKKDLCNGDVMPQTCIIRYGTEGTHYIVMHPFSTDFERLLADMNIHELSPQQLSKFNEANESGASSVELGTRRFEMKDFQKGAAIFAPHLVSYPRQRLANGIVIKFLKYDSTILNYMVCILGRV